MLAEVASQKMRRSIDNNRVFECPAKLVRRLVRRLSGTSIGISKTPCLFPSACVVDVLSIQMPQPCTAKEGRPLVKQ